jgi:hypothetical protein
MRIGLSLKPGRSGTKKLVALYGERLVCVRYRYDEKKKKRFKTVELIIEEISWEPRAKLYDRDEIVGVELKTNDDEMRARVLRAGGKWNAARKVWQIRYDRAIQLGLRSRIRGIETI